MTVDFLNLRLRIEQLAKESDGFFASIPDLDDYDILGDSTRADLYWSQLDDSHQDRSNELQAILMEVIRTIANSTKHSMLLSEADTRDLGTWAKSLRASLRLRAFHAWDVEVLHDEGLVLGVQPAGQSDTDPVTPFRARKNFTRDITNVASLAELLDVSPTLATETWRANPQATAEYEPNTAFVMMRIDPEERQLEDLYNAIKECFAQFEIQALRADEIEHEEVITNKIIEKIESSEFLFADLTSERPSVYYEIGYAHALDRKVIMFRRSDEPLHFNLAAYNYPEYSNLTDLKERLMRRLEQITNRKPTNS